MRINRRFVLLEGSILAAVLWLSSAVDHSKADTGTCNGATVMLPFTDVMGNPFFCQIATAYFSGLTSGTSATTFNPSGQVTRDQMTAFITRAQDGALRRGSPRAALNQWWTLSDAPPILRSHFFIGRPNLLQSDGRTVWVPNGDFVTRLSVIDEEKLITVSGTTNAFSVIIVGTYAYATGRTTPGKLYYLDGTTPTATELANNLGDNPEGLVFDGAHIWTANNGTLGGTGSVSRGRGGLPWQTFTTGFFNPSGIIFDGASVWVTDSDGYLKKLDVNGNILQRVPAGNSPLYPTFDGTNIWVPNFLSNSVTVVRAATGAVVATLTGNGLNGPLSAAFDGQRIMVISYNDGSLSQWNATDLRPLGSFTPYSNSQPFGVCSDGLSFWVTFQANNSLIRF